MTKTEDLLDCESKYSKHELEESAINLVAKVWSYCDVLRDVGVGYGDYVEQITYLLFLKMADEMTKPPENRPAVIPRDSIGRACLQKMVLRSKNNTDTFLSVLQQSLVL